MCWSFGEELYNIHTIVLYPKLYDQIFKLSDFAEIIQVLGTRQRSVKIAWE